MWGCLSVTHVAYGAKFYSIVQEKWKTFFYSLLIIIMEGNFSIAKGKHS